MVGYWPTEEQANRALVTWTKRQKPNERSAESNRGTLGRKQNRLPGFIHFLCNQVQKMMTILDK